MKTPMTLFALALLFTACQQDSDVADAYGNFEATELTLSAEVPGKILNFDAKEGDELNEGQFIAQLDTTQLHLKKQELKAGIKAIKARQPGVASRLDVLKEERENAAREVERFQILAKEGAATAKQVDDLQSRLEVLDRQIASARTEFGPLSAEIETMESRIAQLNEQIKDARLNAPLHGTVLVKLAEAHEMVNAGTPLLRMADLDYLELRAYISGNQLDDVKLGEEVDVLIDQDKANFHRLKGTLSWISDKAEFTPKIIQTKDERVDLVYAIKVRVKNDGRLKIGMPGEVIFNPNEAES
ncbi:HlyD family secretion protein [Catalinimonas alkaloidigena]|uniref:HlyD family secretion protein n=1 Tax=Catalinimonas alkaloidigena TaxID=1075417 RepID=UPI0024055386|nr:HlyD family efflux transporter periplasmic adaptor subunit [Catalinimonas alkaloidigena]MDF9798279.1 HlyD family secretion protein [Catalinimonas alkaloidigena]